MATITLSAEKDPMGAAISDYFNHHRADRLRVFSSQFEEDEIPVKELFRSIQSMPVLERTALQMATGRILDVGAGSGCHALALQEMGKEVCAIDISPLSNEVMKQRGVKDSRLINLFDETFTETFDTVLMLMNGSGIIGTLNNMPAFFQQMKRILRPGGCIHGFQRLTISVRRRRRQHAYRPGRRLLWGSRFPDAIQGCKRRYIRLAIYRFSDS